MIEEQVRKTLVAEIKRQAEARPKELRAREAESTLDVQGRIDLDELTMAIVGSLAGGP